ncbi:hypothetical protein MYSTI_02440 [Myxococcus stipitatus DSM 14675]|uniref:Lipoprotein n=1 Tax=Myxococcus stipitatus (strain DSM 14675 / JCM 12634 / Mx s8) TaxID=1278073 RepID=L7U4K3_MYXSD|nr:hypothetical protein MYSTI_02440 [Myxococcus stipitatus DSM 14675]
MPRVRALTSGLCLLSLLSLAACGDSDESSLRIEGTFESDFDGHRVDHSDFDRYTRATSSRADLPPNVNHLQLCGTSPEGNIGGPRVDWAYCFNLFIDKQLPRGTPATFTLAGRAELPEPPGPNGHRAVFSPREGHSASVRQVWVTPYCGPGDTAPSPVRQEVTGTLELSTYDDTTIAGRLVAEMSGQSASGCPTQRTRADIQFSVPFDAKSNDHHRAPGPPPRHSRPLPPSRRLAPYQTSLKLVSMA